MELQTIANVISGEIVPDSTAARQTIVSGVSHNTAWIEPGFLFFAIRGLKRDAHDFIPVALEKGAAAVAGEGFAGIADLPVPYLRVGNARQSLGDTAALLNGYPSQKLKIVGVTGTKGKTTTAWLARHLLRAVGHKTGILSTLGYKLDDEALHQFPAHFTTPEAPQTQALLAQMVDLGCSHAVVEASSEALALYRLQGTTFDAAVWTNLSPEHLNFHGDMEGYFQAKRILIDNASFAVLNADDAWAMRLTERPYTSYSYQNSEGADWQARDIVEEEGALRFTVRGPDGEFPARLPIIGRYNVANALAALAAVYHLGASVEQLQRGLESFAGTPGRMQIIQEAPVRVIVDFAHTPASLESALKALRQTTEKRLIVVIGSAGGNRDPGKRAPLGAVAAQLADEAIFTEEDCRDTPIAEILNEMKRGADEAGRDNYALIPDRYEAIRHAVGRAEPGDTVVLCGKAGETTLERADVILPWDEAAVAHEIVQANKPGSVV